MSENNVIDINAKKKSSAPKRSNKIVSVTDSRSKKVSAKEALEKYGSFKGLQFRLKRYRTKKEF